MQPIDAWPANSMLTVIKCDKFKHCQQELTISTIARCILCFRSLISHRICSDKLKGDTVASSQFAAVDVSVRLASRAHVYLYFKCIRRQQHLQTAKKKKETPAQVAVFPTPSNKGNKRKQQHVCMYI